MGALAQEHLPSEAERLDARREVDLLADHGMRLVELGAERTHQYRPGIDADAEIQLGQRGVAVLRVQGIHGELQLERARDGALRGVFARRRLAEVRHDRIAHELVDRALVREHHLDHVDEAPVEHLKHRSRRVAVGDRHEAAQVGEEDGELAISEAVLSLPVAASRVAQELRQRRLGVGSEAPAGLRRDEGLYPIYGVPQIHASLLPSSCGRFFL